MSIAKLITLIIILSTQTALAETDMEGLKEVEEKDEYKKVTRNKYQMLKTGKQKLGRKWSDEQRVDNCKVPLELRGSKSRPDKC